jgi:hypothetical protein
MEGDLKMEILTDAEIKQDILEFQDRISAARQKLADLPEGYLPYSERRKREKKRKDLEDNIRHVEKMISIATEALNE